MTQAELPDWNDPSGATGLESPKRSYRIGMTQAELPDWNDPSGATGE